jgi:hypothetical protein
VDAFPEPSEVGAQPVPGDPWGVNPTLLNVECPEGCGTGDRLAITTPDGLEVEVIVPGGVLEFEEFQVSVPAGCLEGADKAASLVESAEASAISETLLPKATEAKGLVAAKAAKQTDAVDSAKRRREAKRAHRLATAAEKAETCLPQSLQSPMPTHATDPAICSSQSCEAIDSLLHVPPGQMAEPEPSPYQGGHRIADVTDGSDVDRCGSIQLEPTPDTTHAKDPTANNASAAVAEASVNTEQEATQEVQTLAQTQVLLPTGDVRDTGPISSCGLISVH